MSTYWDYYQLHFPARPKLLSSILAIQGHMLIFLRVSLGILVLKNGINVICYLKGPGLFSWLLTPKWALHLPNPAGTPDTLQGSQAKKNYFRWSTCCWLSPCRPIWKSEHLHSKWCFCCWKEPVLEESLSLRPNTQERGSCPELSSGTHTSHELRISQSSSLHLAGFAWTHLFLETAIKRLASYFKINK